MADIFSVPCTASGDHTRTSHLLRCFALLQCDEGGFLFCFGGGDSGIFLLMHACVDGMSGTLLLLPNPDVMHVLDIDCIALSSRNR